MMGHPFHSLVGNGEMRNEDEGTEQKTMVMVAMVVVLVMLKTPLLRL